MNTAKGVADPKGTILQLTCMHSTKYGALERYFVELTRICTAEGRRCVFQYEAPPCSAAYRQNLAGAGGEVIVSRLGGSPVPALWRAARLMRAVRPDILHVHLAGTLMAAAAPRIARRCGAQRTLFTVHLNPPAKGNPLTLALRTLATRFSLGGYDTVLPVSEATRDALVRRGADPARLIVHHLGLIGERIPSPDLRRGFRREFGIPGQEIALACIGFDNPVKGLDVLVQAFSLVLREHPGAQLLIIGVDPARSNLPRLAAGLGIGDRIHWAGARDEGWRLLNAADIYVQPSRSEALSLAVIEAMALGLPVVASRTGALDGETVVEGESGLLAPVGDAPALAAALAQLVSQPGLRQRLGAGGRARYLGLFRGEDSVRNLVARHYRV